MDALVFDFDGLILDTEWPAYVTVAAAFEAHGSEMSLERWQDRLGRGDNLPWTEMLAADVGPIDHEEVESTRRERKNAITDAQPLQPGVVDLLDEADREGLAVGVASSSPMSWVDRHLERHGIRSRFATVKTRDLVERAKPWPDLFLSACEALGVDPSRSLAFEDSVHGVTAAKAAGLYCVAVPNRVTAISDFSHADLVVSSLTDFDLSKHL